MQNSDLTHEKKLDKKNNYYSENALVFLKNPDNRKATSDDILEDKIDMYFKQNGEHPSSNQFNALFAECRSLCKNCLYYDKINIINMPTVWQAYANQVGQDQTNKRSYGRCCVQPPVVILNPTDTGLKKSKSELKTVYPIVYPHNYCAQFYHRVIDKRGLYSSQNKKLDTNNSRTNKDE